MWHSVVAAKLLTPIGRRRKFIVCLLTMISLSFRICLTAVTLLHSDFAIGLDLQDIVKTIEAKGEYSENGSRQHFSKMKSLVIFIPDLLSELAGKNYQEARKILLRSQDLSDDLSKVDIDKLKTAPIIQTNISNDAWDGYESTADKHRPKRTSKERTNIRLQQTMEQKERDHEIKVKEIVDHVSEHYQSCKYLAYEAQRIKTGRIVMDDFRKMAEDVDKQKYQGLKAKALKCGQPIPEPAPFVWHKPNSLMINFVKDPLNDGVY